MTGRSGHIRRDKKLAMEFHPDRNKSKEAEEKFKEISEAYAVLSDSEKKKTYDRNIIKPKNRFLTERAVRRRANQGIPFRRHPEDTNV